MRGTNKRRLTGSVANQGEGSFARIWENRARSLPENSNLGLERGLGQSSADSHGAGRETGADSKAVRGHRTGVLVSVSDILQCPLKLPLHYCWRRELSIPAYQPPHLHPEWYRKDQWGMAMTRLLEAPSRGISPPSHPDVQR